MLIKHIKINFNKVRVEQVEHCNQFEITLDNNDYTSVKAFQSYKSLIAVLIQDGTYKYLKLFDNYDYSRTTKKHLNIWLSWYGITLTKEQLITIYNYSTDDNFILID